MLCLSSHAEEFLCAQSTVQLSLLDHLYEAFILFGLWRALGICKIAYNMLNMNTLN